MPPSQQSPSADKLAVSSGEQVSLTVEPREQALREFRMRKSARLVEMVNGLQKSMEAMISKREYYAQRSIELEQALTQRAPEALYKSITISTIKVADIMMELEDLHEKKTELERKVNNLQQNEDIQKNLMDLEMEKLQARYDSLEKEVREKEEDLKTKLSAANEEVATIQKKYAKTRKEYHTCTRNIALMASKIATVQRENNKLRVEADASHRALIEMERQVEALKGGKASETIQQEDANITIQHLQSQLETSRFENEKLIAERTANHSVIQELQKQVQDLQATLREQQQSRGIVERTNATPPQSLFPMFASQMFATNFSRSVATDATNSDDTESTSSNLDNLLTIVRSMSGQSSSASTEVAANTSKRYESDDSDDSSEDDYDPYSTSNNRAARHDDSPNMIRRLAVNINGLEGSYTGPLGPNGLPNGTGTIRFKNGDTYLGTLKDGQLHGKGAMYYASNRKTTFRGTFVNNHPVM